MLKSYIGVLAIIFALVAIGHVMRIVQGWQVQVGGMGVAMSVSWVASVGERDPCAMGRSAAA